MIMEKALGWHDELIEKHPIYTMFFIPVFIVMFVMALREKKMAFYNGQMTWKQGFIAGVFISLFSMILAPLTQYIISVYITPNYFANAIEKSVEMGYYTQEEAEGYFTLGNYIKQNTIGTPIMGIIVSAIIALFVKSKNK